MMPNSSGVFARRIGIVASCSAKPATISAVTGTSTDEAIRRSREVDEALAASRYPAFRRMAALTTGAHALLKSTLTDYTVDGNGNDVAVANNPGGCR